MNYYRILKDLGFSRNCINRRSVQNRQGVVILCWLVLVFTCINSRGIIYVVQYRLLLLVPQSTERPNNLPMLSSAYEVVVNKLAPHALTVDRGYY